MYGEMNMGLPILTTVDDVQQLAGYLKNKPTGATISEIKAALGKGVVDERKLNSYQTWGERVQIDKILARHPK
jgi:hypothetical protein